MTKRTEKPSVFVKRFERQLTGANQNYLNAIELIKKNVYQKDLEILRPLMLCRVMHDGTSLEQATLLTMCSKLGTTPKDISKEAVYYMFFVMNMTVMSYPILQNKEFSVNIEYYDTSNPLKVLKLFQIFDTRTMMPVKMERPLIVNLIKNEGKTQIRALSEEDIFYTEFYENKLKAKQAEQESK